MFHTFQSSAGLRSSGNDADGALGKPSRPAGSRRISTSNACVECRRRKIRCDGTQPCGQCQWYQHPEACSYSKPAQRVVPSRKLVDKLSSNIEQYKSVLSTLFPSKDVVSLTSLSREELLELALSSAAPGQNTSPSTATTLPLSEPGLGSDGAESLEALEQAPPEDPYWDEARKHQVRVQGISDDVNGLSMSVERLSSYVGISSITAALKVILRCAPYARALLAQNNHLETAVPSRAGSPRPEGLDNNPDDLPPKEHGSSLIESYFERVHPFMPMIEEQRFWSTFLHANRRDSAWLALLNIVFALGSLASSTADNEAHYVYYERARQHLSLESFGSGSLEVLQALAIMSGYYMHYLNRPNEAHSLMGGTLRMATALGLHREYTDVTSKSESNNPPRGPAPSDEISVSAEMRRRIWWSLFCLDAWASTTTGRPSLGRMGMSITVRQPGTASDAPNIIPHPDSPQYLDHLKVLPLIHASEFCRIATNIQDRLVETPLLSTSETSAYDADIIHWHEQLPTILTNASETCPDFLRRVRCIMKWRYQNLRLVLHRPVLLNTALRRCPFNELSSEEKVAVGKCRMVAAKTIDDISMECLPDLICGWNAVWFTFQACMVPLISLFSDSSMPEDVKKWCASIETALGFFERSGPWSIAAKRSKDAVAKLYQAYKLQQSAVLRQNQKVQQQPQQQLQQQPTQFAQSNTEMERPFQYDPASQVSNYSVDPSVKFSWASDPASGAPINGFWDDMLWDTNMPDMMETSYGWPSDYDFTGAAQDSGGPCWMQGN